MSCYDSIGTRETIINLQEEFELLKRRYKETGNVLYKNLSKMVQRRLKELEE